MTKRQKVAEWNGPGGRPETGPMQFGDDWPGIFIRGDNAMYYARQLGAAAIAMQALGQSNFDAFVVSTLKGLERLMASADVRNDADGENAPQKEGK